MNDLYPAQASQIQADRHHLLILSIFHYFVGGIVVLIGSLFLLQIFFGVMLVRDSGPLTQMLDATPTPASPAATPEPTASPAEADATPASADAQESPSATLSPADRQEAANELRPLLSRMMYVMVGFGAAAVLAGFLTGVLLILSGVGMARQRWRGLSLAMAAISCLGFPFGTILGIFTFVVLLRPSVTWLYQHPGATGDEPPPPLPAA